jgi:hypothetical protein
VPALDEVTHLCMKQSTYVQVCVTTYLLVSLSNTVLGCNIFSAVSYTFFCCKWQLRTGRRLGGNSVFLHSHALNADFEHGPRNCKRSAADRSRRCLSKRRAFVDCFEVLCKPLTSNIQHSPKNATPKTQNTKHVLPCTCSWQTLANFSESSLPRQ